MDIRACACISTGIYKKMNMFFVGAKIKLPVFPLVYIKKK